MSPPYRLDRSFISVTGQDTRGFLNNLVTQNLDLLSADRDVQSFMRARRASGATNVVYASLLSPQGKLVADMMIWPQLNGAVIELDTSRSSDLLHRLSMYKLRAAVDLHDTSTAFMTIWSDQPFENGIPDPRLPALGWRKLAARDEAENGNEAFETHRIALGVPDLARDAAPEEVFALEGLLEELNGVDFQKGCFVGQENVSRMKRRATTRKKFCPVVFEGDPPPFGTPVRAGEADLGSVRSGVAGRAIALLRLDRAFEATEKGQPLTAGDKPVRLDPPPWLLLPARDD